MDITNLSDAVRPAIVDALGLLKRRLTFGASTAHDSRDQNIKGQQTGGRYVNTACNLCMHEALSSPPPAGAPRDSRADAEVTPNTNCGS